MFSGEKVLAFSPRLKLAYHTLVLLVSLALLCWVSWMSEKGKISDRTLVISFLGLGTIIAVCLIIML